MNATIIAFHLLILKLRVQAEILEDDYNYIAQPHVLRLSLSLPLVNDNVLRTFACSPGYYNRGSTRSRLCVPKPLSTVFVPR